MPIAVIVTTHNRPFALQRTLPQVAALGRPMLVVDDGTKQASVLNYRICHENNADYLLIPENRGLAAALNIGLSYWLADRSYHWISYFQDDVDVHPDLFREMERVTRDYRGVLYTGHDSMAHQTVHSQDDIKVKKSCAGLHLHARREFWLSVMPIPTLQLGAPKRLPGRERGIGSNVDWWIVRDAPNSPAKRRERIVCLPNMVRTFISDPHESTWGNDPKWGEDLPLRGMAVNG